ncbi:L-2-hydroxyglutarate oxidase [soil metagenome]
MSRHDVVVIGAGIVGLATATALTRLLPGVDVVVMDKEPVVASHQTSHNSGVIHSGLYYTPGSLKAHLCVKGRRSLEEFCEEARVPWRKTGKMVVATTAREVEAMDELERRGHANGLTGIERLGPSGIRDLEPHATGIAALHVEETGVTDFGAVARALADRLEGDVRTGTCALRIHEGDAGVEVETTGGTIAARTLVNCAGLHSDRIAAATGIEAPVRIIPFRGEYHLLTTEGAELVRGLIYPVPDPRFPFLGVHFTRGIDDMVEVGPNAVLALGREHYRGASPDWAEVRATVTSRRFARLAARYWRAGSTEIVRSRSRRLYARSARHLIPEIHHRHLTEGGAGVRAQAVTPQGRLVDDFSVVHGERSVHVLNAPSPAATASLAIGEHIAGLVADRR